MRVNITMRVKDAMRNKNSYQEGYSKPDGTMTIGYSEFHLHFENAHLAIVPGCPGNRQLGIIFAFIGNRQLGVEFPGHRQQAILFGFKPTRSFYSGL